MLENMLQVFTRIQAIEEKFGQVSVNKMEDVSSPTFKETLSEVKGGKTDTKGYPYQYAELINNASQKYGIDAKLIESIIKAESNFNPQAVSSKGACGLMQLMPQTARSLGVKNIFAPEENIDGGVKYLKDMLNKFNQNVPLALAAYNAGPETVKKAGGVPSIIETQNYVAKVLRYFQGS
ncbi:lytic murein transglycosylase [Candidatus Desantisbacteria bacterium CG_4_8_14_3_um_filter_40_12]|uniref:Lytic murein transglycosylase n=2 Tax=unclassified Candidatus Desantisiibacteriota TaxID=3106372 RepID=A0A2M7JCS4_9BACT|nr:MAG: lytic murein transglycosylase [Candidatus Desantisbacteria bacterium CG23_combo_of_CG06-09_8_20_14_all_40_23]PIX17191.1 MAG: lytic murein transglycosylase [Candidatus Desantisbacteria bacterium CG_4_8_14_3_um_filter_40_12]